MIMMVRFNYIKKHILNNYQLTFRSKYGACDIERKVGKKVYGALYIISKCAEKRLDVYEEYPTLYKKIFPDFMSELEQKNIPIQRHSKIYKPYNRKVHNSKYNKKPKSKTGKKKYKSL